MKTLTKPSAVLAILVLALSLSACGKTSRTSSTTEGNTVVVPPTTPPPVTPPPVPPPPVTPPPTPTNPPLSYEFNKIPGTSAGATPNTIMTDNVLKVKFVVTPEQGNVVWKATELKVIIQVNGVQVTPLYYQDTANCPSGCTFGRVGETSGVIDLSSYITPGQPIQITVKDPENDFYCTYWGGYYFDTSLGKEWFGYYPVAQQVNPQYNQYPGCRKRVFSSHYWSGRLIVQTSNTQAI